MIIKKSLKDYTTSFKYVLYGFGFIIIAFLIGDIFNLSEWIHLHLRLDWPMIICTFVSAVATFSLGVISVKQNNILAALNEKSIEVAKISNGYSLIQFRDTQTIEDDGKALRIKIFDTRNNPLRGAFIKQVRLQTMKDRWNPTGNDSIILSNSKYDVNLKYTPVSFGELEDYYYAVIPVDFPVSIFNKGDFLRLEFDFEIENSLGIITAYKYYIMASVSEKDDKVISLYKYHEFNYCQGIRA